MQQHCANNIHKLELLYTPMTGAMMSSVVPYLLERDYSYTRIHLTASLIEARGKQCICRARAVNGIKFKCIQRNKDRNIPQNWY